MHMRIDALIGKSDDQGIHYGRRFYELMQGKEYDIK